MVKRTAFADPYSKNARFKKILDGSNAIKIALPACFQTGPTLLGVIAFADHAPRIVQEILVPSTTPLMAKRNALAEITIFLRMNSRCRFRGQSASLTVNPTAYILGGESPSSTVTIN